MNIFFWHVCMWTMCLPDALGDRKMASFALELELQVVGNCHVGAGNRTQLYYIMRVTCALDCWTISLAMNFSPILEVCHSLPKYCPRFIFSLLFSYDFKKMQYVSWSFLNFPLLLLFYNVAWEKVGENPILMKNINTYKLIQLCGADAISFWQQNSTASSP